MNLPRLTTAASVAAAALTFAVTAHATSTSDDAPGSHRDWGLTWDIRAGDAGGDYGGFLQKGAAWDMAIFKQRGDWRYGAGLMFSSLRMKSPYEHELEWAHFETSVFASRVFRNDESIRPYLQGRVAVVRMHPRSELFLKKPVEELQPGESPTDAVNGIGLSVIPGVEFEITPGLAIDLSAYLNFYATKSYNTAAIDQPNPGSGSEWGARIGATWRPTSFDKPEHASATPDTTPLPPPSHLKDAWGVTRSPGWAAGEVLAINFGASMFNEYVRQANFNQISPRSFWHNLEEGFNYDDNKFKTNQLVHPFNGSTYYNSGRSNGLGFWPSTICAITGAFIWEAMGETHPMSYNDMISTGIGGIAVGEATYRISSTILDNTATGSGRTWREIGAFLVDPIHGFNRFVSGRASRVEGNPSSPYDWRPPHYADVIGLGARITGKGESIHDSTQTQVVLDLYLNHGSPWDNARRKPFDHFDFGFQINGDDKVPVGRLQIRGDLFSKGLGDPNTRKHAIAFEQYFDYINNNAFEFGGQSFGVALYSRFRPSAKIGITTRVDLLAMLLGGVNSEYAHVQDTLDQERRREYDYGSGGGVSLEVGGSYKGNRILSLSYRAQVVHVSNGSIYNPNEGNVFDANHYIQAGGVKLNIPVRGAMSVGLDGSVFIRDSQFSDPDLVDAYQRVPQARLYLSWQTSR